MFVDVEVVVSVGGFKVSGYLCVMVLVGFGCCYVVLLVLVFLVEYVDLSLLFNFSDCIVDIVYEGFDCVVCVGDLLDFSFISMWLVDNWWLCVVVLSYLKCVGMLWYFDEFGCYVCFMFSFEVS